VKAMSSDGLGSLIEDARNNSSLRLRLSQDRSADEMAASANQKGYAIDANDARKILAGAYLTSNDVSQSERQALVGGFSWDYLEKIENRLDGDYRFLEDEDAWERAREFYEYVYAP
jgi:hypothetical protein